MKFELNDFHRNIPDQEIIDDLKRVFEILNDRKIKLTCRSYNDHGKFSAATVQTRFASWNNALNQSGIEINEEKNVSIEKLFQNLENVWIQKGSQPVYRDLASNDSKCTAGVYAKRFGSWRKALKAFVKYINEDDPEEILVDNANDDTDSINQTKKHKTSRNISDRMRFRILSRDGFTCQACGASPIKERGVELHVDHIVPWSNGGETIEENLQTKCKHCNLGKGNAFSV